MFLLNMAADEALFIKSGMLLHKRLHRNFIESMPDIMLWLKVHPRCHFSLWDFGGSLEARERRAGIDNARLRKEPCQTKNS